MPPVGTSVDYGLDGGGVTGRRGAIGIDAAHVDGGHVDVEITQHRGIAHRLQVTARAAATSTIDRGGDDRYRSMAARSIRSVIPSASEKTRA